MAYRPVSPALPHCRDIRRPHSRCLCRRVGLRGDGVRLWRLPWASGLVLPITRGEHEASAEEIRCARPNIWRFSIFKLTFKG